MAYNHTIPPGNTNDTNLTSTYKQSYDYANNFHFKNLTTATSVNVPTYTFIKANIDTDNCVIIVCGGGWKTLVIEPEISNAVEYWKTQNVNIYVLFYRTPILDNKESHPYDITNYYNMNAYPFLLLYDLDNMVKIVKQAYPFGKLGLNGFSAGGNTVSVYASIITYNYDIMRDINFIVNETHNNINLPFPSTSFMNFINKYSDGNYPQARPNQQIDFLLLMYSVVDLTIPQKKPIPVFLDSISPHNCIYPLTLLYSSKLFKDGVSDPLTSSGTMSMITHNYPPTYFVSSSDDPFIPLSIGNVFCQNLLKNNIPIYRQLYPKGGHGFGLGYCFDSQSKYPLNLYPYKFFERTIQKNYINTKLSEWFNLPTNPPISPNTISFNEFLKNILFKR
jgi:acetyl esterase/lipase